MRRSNLVIGETWTWLRRRTGHGPAVRFADLISRFDLVSVAFADDTIDERAWSWLRQRDDRAFSYVDATSFGIMRRGRITEALAFDGDFSAAGFLEAKPTG